MIPAYTFGMGELLIVLAIVLIFFGVGKLPQVLRSMGQGVKEFRDAATGAEDIAKEIDVSPAEATAEKVRDAEEVKVENG